MSWMIKKLEGVGVILNRVFLALLTVWALGAILLTLTHIALAFEKTPYPIIEWFPNLVLEVLFKTNAAELSKNNIYEVIVADMIAICAFVFAVAPAVQAGIYKINLKVKLRKAHGLEVFKVKNEGIDDLRKMLECFKRAEHITVFCGDFDWLQPSNLTNSDKYKESKEKQQKRLLGQAERMNKFVVDYASHKKITLVSSKSIELVKTALNNKGKDSLFKELEGRFVFGVKIGIKCSLIEHIHSKYAFLYRSHSDDKSHSFNAHIFTGATESEELISILRNLIEFGDWKSKAGQHLKSSA